MGGNVYLTEEEAAGLLFMQFNVAIPREDLNTLGVKWLHKENCYVIVDKKRWLLSKLKYGL
jgi:hypothetical protein